MKAADLSLDDCYIANLVPCQAPANVFAKHDPRDVAWGLELLAEELASSTAQVVILLGANPLKYVAGIEQGGVSKWRGSVLPDPCPPMHSLRDYEDAVARLQDPGRKFVITYHPAAILRGFHLHTRAIVDFKKARSLVDGTWQPPRQREIIEEDPVAFEQWLHDYIYTGENVVAIDTEMDPMVVAVAGQTQCHVFRWKESFRASFTELMKSPRVLKIAHNVNHDWTWVRNVFDIAAWDSPLDEHGPHYDTGGASHILHCVAADDNDKLMPGKSLETAVSLYTSWPHHKWLSEHDSDRYCAYDAITCRDVYYPQLKLLSERGLLPIFQHDLKLTKSLLRMQWRGLRVDELARYEAEEQLSAEYQHMEEGLMRVVEPIVREKLSKFKKPHLFFKRKRCKCCNGKFEGCWRCSGFTEQPKKKSDWVAYYGEGKKIAEYKAMLASCANCEDGKQDHWLPISLGSSDQVGDIIYRGLGIAPRKQAGKETVNADRLSSIADRHPLIQDIVELADKRADLKTVERLRPGWNGRLHCVLDAWGTSSGRVAGKEGLIQVGTNPMNIPKIARRMIVPDDGYFFLYPDYSQIEGRCIAVLTEDERLWSIYAEGVPDSHIALRDILDRESGIRVSRPQIKRVLYASVYGVKPYFLETQLYMDYRQNEEGLNPTRGDGDRILQAVFKTFPGIPRWRKRVELEIAETRELRSPTGRSFMFPGPIRDRKTGGIAHHILRKAWSRYPQDMGAYILANGIFDIEKHPDLFTPLMHVHDACLIQAPLERQDEAMEVARECMSQEFWGMKFPAEPISGANWYEAS